MAQVTIWARASGAMATAALMMDGTTRGRSSAGTARIAEQAQDGAIGVRCSDGKAAMAAVTTVGAKARLSVGSRAPTTAPTIVPAFSGRPAATAWAVVCGAPAGFA